MKPFTLCVLLGLATASAWWAFFTVSHTPIVAIAAVFLSIGTLTVIGFDTYGDLDD